MNRISLALLLAMATLPATARASDSQVVNRQIDSKSFSDNKIGTNPVRKMAIYLPAGYDASNAHYPVIFFLPNDFDGDYRSIFDAHAAQTLFDQAITESKIQKFVLVAVDMSTSLGNSWSVNSPVTGNWEDFAVQELIPYIDAHFRTLANRDSRGIAGSFMGGYGAIRLAMEHPDIFGAVYAMHPVGTGSGLKIMDGIPNWDILANAKSMDDVKKDGGALIFTTIFQAHLPNPDKPPLYIDLSAHKEGDQLVIDSRLMAKLRDNFFIESMVPQYADNLKSLRGFKFDWDRSDQNQDHVYSNQALTHKLNEFGIRHEAEEYNGTWGEPNWGIDGRVYSEVLPFFEKHLVFEKK
jgi:pimeloyl-ACP methyl ester carboxylesterase